ncbi:MAG: beta-galactosidase [Clostridia bacterium]|nr:beta-galactosidase [Clostridia bacterium]
MLDGKRIELGVCYYPEHWDKSLWRDDLRRMQEHGIRVIRVAEFSWNLFEPKEGCFDDSFWDEFLDIAEEAKMQVIFCTPTATPPAWLTEKYPEVLNCDIYGHPYYHGCRKHHNMTSPVYLEFVRRITEHIAEHYSRHPAIIGWQIDNEVNCETAVYHAPSDHAAFRAYMKKKYGTLENLNRAMGTAFWNQTYTDWDEIHLSRNTLGANTNNPHMMLEERRFISEAAQNYIGLQADILRKYRRADQFITTNGIFGMIDNHKLTREQLDFMTYDSYPNFAFGLDTSKLQERSLRDRETSYNLIRTRSVSNRFGIMEQQSGPGGWNTRMVQPSPKPGQLRLWTFQSVAHGADFVSYFRWRTCAMGTEMYWHGLLNYDNRDNRRLAELKRTYQDIEKIQSAAGAKVTAKIALLCDYDNEWDGMEDKWHGPLRWQSLDGWFKALERAHIPFDFVNIDDDGTSEPLEGYDVVVYPHPTIITEARAAELKAYAENGGTLIFGCRSGYKDINGQAPMTPMPGVLRELTGGTVEDFTFIGPADAPVSMVWNGKLVPTPAFNDILKPVADTCEIAAVYDGNYYAGAPALLKNAVGKGTVYAFGSVFGEETVNAFIRELGLKSPVSALLDIPEEVELSVREAADGTRYIFLLNYSEKAQEITAHTAIQDQLTETELCGTYTMQPYDVLVLKNK